MPYDVKLPDIGEGVAEGEIVRWLVQAGEAVKEDQPLVEVMTDKASVEIPSPRTGTVAALHAEEGAVVPVGTVIVSIAVAGETPGAPGPAGAGSGGPARTSTASAPQAASSAVNVRDAAPAAPVRVPATPAVRALAKELGVALESLAGTGPGGAVTADDVKRAAGSAAPASRAAEGETRQPLRGLRRKIAEHMRHSLSTAAQFTFVAECDWTEVVAHRAALKAEAEAAGVRLTYLAWVVKAIVQPLRDHPLLNASLDDAKQEIVLKRRQSIGIATATPDGLTVPVLHDADRLTLFAVAREIERLSAAARDHSIRLEEVQGATFTLTSTGARGGVLATPILHHPQVAILGVHEVRKKPAVVDGEIVIRDLGNLSLSLDHRVVDGQVGADFLYAVIQRLEDPRGWLGPKEVA